MPPVLTEFPFNPFAVHAKRTNSAAKVGKERKQTEKKEKIDAPELEDLESEF